MTVIDEFMAEQKKIEELMDKVPIEIHHRLENFWWEPEVTQALEDIFDGVADTSALTERLFLVLDGMGFQFPSGGSGVLVKGAPTIPRCVIQGTVNNDALIVVDMLEDFVDPFGALCIQGAEFIIPEVNQLIEEFSNTLVIFANDAHNLNDPEFKEFPPHAVIGTSGANICSHIRPPKNYEVVEKRTFDAFSNGKLQDILESNAVRDLCICGVATEICVKATAKSALELGYYVIIHRSAIKEIDGKKGEEALIELEKAGAKICV